MTQCHEYNVFHTNSRHSHSHNTHTLHTPVLNTLSASSTFIFQATPTRLENWLWPALGDTLAYSQHSCTSKLVCDPLCVVTAPHCWSLCLVWEQACHEQLHLVDKVPALQFVQVHPVEGAPKLGPLGTGYQGAVVEVGGSCLKFLQLSWCRWHLGIDPHPTERPTPHRDHSENMKSLYIVSYFITHMDNHLNWRNGNKYAESIW